MQFSQENGQIIVYRWGWRRSLLREILDQPLRRTGGSTLNGIGPIQSTQNRIHYDSLGFGLITVMVLLRLRCVLR